MDELFVKCFIEAFKEMVDCDIKKFISLHGNNEDKILQSLKNKYKNICDINEILDE